MDLDRCSWKMVDPESFVLGQSADRCGEVAAVKILRPNRKTDLFLCEKHVNKFIEHWGLHNRVEILCHNYMEGLNEPSCIDPSCKKCLPDDPRSWRHS